MVAMLSVSITSCGDDDDDGGSISSNGSETAGQFTVSGGQKVWVSSISGYDNYTFTYDENHRLTGINGSTVSFNPFAISYDGDRFSDIKLNKNGYITEMKYNGDEGNGTIQFSYDGSGHMTHIVWVINFVEDGESGTWRYDGSLTWNNNRLVSHKFTEVDSSDPDYEPEEYIYQYGDNLYPNITHQWTPCELEGELPDLAPFFCLGYLGKAGDYLPSECDGSTISYTFNSDGSVATASGNGNGTYRFSYLTE